MNNKVLTLSACLLVACSTGLDAPPTFANSTSGFVHPESALWDPTTRTWFVSNIGQFQVPSDGFVSRLDEAGNMLARQFVSGLDDPKGLGVLDGRLYVADVTHVTVVDLKATSNTVTLNVPEAVFLNDVAVDAAGRAVYVSDSFGNAIFRLQKGKVSMVLRDARLETPNGLAVQGDELFIASVGPEPDPATFIPSKPGRLWSLHLPSATLSAVTERVAPLDGLVVHGDEFLASDTFTGVYHVDADGETQLYVDNAALGLQGSADIGFDPVSRRLAVPQLFGDTVSFFTFD